MTNASGTFVVDLRPLDLSFAGEHGASLNRLSIDKTFSGGLQGTSKGEMISARTAVPQSAGYVALEQVNGVLNGRAGSFILQHFGIATAEGNRLILEVVPNSGTGELATIQGQMAIDIIDGEHKYVFTYTL